MPEQEFCFRIISQLSQQQTVNSSHVLDVQVHRESVGRSFFDTLSKLAIQI
ncbi:Unknown protein sequence [Pseudomonas amygdali pv. lachrymans]|nr:Unknown protein sequence [Pseudomonas amygdali pv. lachrymans]